jgi:glycine/D-amino acid oxidase-like deaminating enzyme/nitrite reductase/ring-hydroxylating ferredoxin subunit
MDVDVVVVGAGIVGLTAAYRLVRAGKSVLVLDARRIGHQATGRSTAKITSQHGLIYTRLIQEVGEDNARIYAQANQRGLNAIADLVEEHQINCGFERAQAYVYTETRNGKAQIEEEARVAAKLGLPARLMEEAPEPMSHGVALCFDEQAQFNPVQYLHGLASALAANIMLCEDTRVVEVKNGEPMTVKTEDGFTVRARDVIVATHLPVVPQGMFFAKAYPYSHSVVAAEIDPARVPEGMWISLEKPTHSFRIDRSSDATYLVAAGQTYKTGVTVDEQASFQDLDRFLRETFGIHHTAYRWTNEDFEPMDGLPFIGRASGGSPHLYVATGFNAWGITTGTVAATLIRDLILGRPNECESLFDAKRIRPLQGGAEFLKENFKTAKHLIGDRFQVEHAKDLDLRAGDAVVANVQGENIAAYRDDSGRLHALSAVCTHMGCLVGWNATDHSWDCPCHGSRFAVDGSVIHGPATQALKQIPGRHDDE